MARPSLLSSRADSLFAFLLFALSILSFSKISCAAPVAIAHANPHGYEGFFLLSRDPTKPKTSTLKPGKQEVTSSTAKAEWDSIKADPNGHVFYTDWKYGSSKDVTKYVKENSGSTFYNSLYSSKSYKSKHDSSYPTPQIAAQRQSQGMADHVDKYATVYRGELAKSDTVWQNIERPRILEKGATIYHMPPGKYKQSECYAIETSKGFTYKPGYSKGGIYSSSSTSSPSKGGSSSCRRDGSCSFKGIADGAGGEPAEFSDNVPGMSIDPDNGNIYFEGNTYALNDDGSLYNVKNGKSTANGQAPADLIKDSKASTGYVQTKEGIVFSAITGDWMQPRAGSDEYIRAVMPAGYPLVDGSEGGSDVGDVVFEGLEPLEGAFLIEDRTKGKGVTKMTDAEFADYSAKLTAQITDSQNISPGKTAAIPEPDQPATPDPPGTPDQSQTTGQKGSQTPDDPASQTPTDPTSQTPEDPSSQTPEDPSSQTPEDPGSQTPDDPTSQTPDDPGSQTPETPDNPNGATKPKGQLGAKPPPPPAGHGP